MTERDFELLDILSQTGNITKAADRLYITQSSLSKRIVTIEEELGVTILLRSRQGIHFTPEGETVLEHTRKAGALMNAMRAELTTRKDEICGTLNAGVSINFAQYRLPALLGTYKKKYPHVNTHIISGHSRNQYMKVLDGSIDVAILRGEFLWNENRILISREPVCAIMNTEFELSDLDQVPFISRRTDASFERELARWLHENDIHITNTGIVVDNISTCVEMVKNGPYPYMLKRRVLSDNGHLSNENCGKMITDICTSRLKYVILGHLSGENNTPHLAFNTSRDIMQNQGIEIGEDGDVKMYVAAPFGVKRRIEI